MTNSIITKVGPELLKDSSKKMEPLNCDFIFFIHAINVETREQLTSDWDGLYPRNIIIDTIRSKLDFKSKVLCVERPVNMFTPVRHFSKFRRWLRRKNILRDINKNLFIYLPCTFLPDWWPLNYNLVTFLNRKLLQHQLMRLIRKYRFESKRRIVWVYHPFQIDSLGLVNEDYVIYECHDEYLCDPSPIMKKFKHIIEQKERELIKKADIVFTTSKLLHENKSRHNLNTFYIPNAADIKHFRKTQDPDIEESIKVKMIKKPIIGYLGTIHNATDIELLTYIAGKRLEWSFVLIGPTEEGYKKTTSYKKFKKLPNVYFLGWIDYEELPSILKAFNVGIIPYKVDSEFNQNVNPNKLHEYMAMGKPIVSVDLPEVRLYRDIISIAHDKDEFLELIEKAIHEDNNDKIAQRLKVAEENSWEKRVNNMLAIIKNRIEKDDEAKK